MKRPRSEASEEDEVEVTLSSTSGTYNVHVRLPRRVVELGEPSRNGNGASNIAGLAALADCAAGRAAVDMPAADVLIWLAAVARPEHVHTLRKQHLAAVLKVRATSSADIHVLAVARTAASRQSRCCCNRYMLRI